VLTTIHQYGSRSPFQRNQTKFGPIEWNLKVPCEKREIIAGSGKRPCGTQLMRDLPAAIRRPLLTPVIA
jgi:hypothetical protein